MNRASSEISKSHSFDVIDGLADCSCWYSSMEGPLTRISKIAIVNTLGAKDLCRILFGTRLLNQHAKPFHGRSLLSGRWMKEGGELHPLAESISDSVLEQSCGRWARWISSDMHFRYCPECLNDGFQSVVYQIDAIQQCPLHRIDIVDWCLECGAKTGPYALTEEVLRSPIHCQNCFSPLGRSWQKGSEMMYWQQQSDIRPLREMQIWLNQVGQAEINWPGLDTWLTQAGEGAYHVDKRKAVFAVLANLHPLPTSIQASVPGLRIVFGDCEGASILNRAAMLHPDEIKQRTAIYKSIKRNSYKSHRLNLALGGRDRGGRYSVDWRTDSILPKQASTAPIEHALLIWQSRFEDGFRSTALNARDCALSAATVLRIGMAIWPVNWCTNAVSWGNFAYLCMLEDIWTAQQWQLEVAAFAAPDSDAADLYSLPISYRAAWLEAYSKWLPRLSSKQEDWPQSITTFQWQISPKISRLVTVSLDHRRPPVAPIEASDHLFGNTPTRAEVEIARHSELGHRPAFAPLESLVAPHDLIGSPLVDGLHGDGPNDIELVRQWTQLASSNSSRKIRVYAAEKLLNWAYFCKHKELSALTRDDFAEFGSFLGNPEPAAWWICGKSTRRGNPQWAPFAGVLSQNSRRTVMSMVANLADWLRENGYASLFCAHGKRALENGFANSIDYLRSGISTSPGSCMTEPEWLCVMRFLYSEPQLNGDELASRLIVELLYFAALSVNEAVRLTFANLIPPGSDQSHWTIAVIDGRGRSVRAVPVPPPLGQTLAAWSALVQLEGALVDEVANCIDTDRRLLHDFDAQEIHRRIKRVFRESARRAETSDGQSIAPLLMSRTVKSFRGAFSAHLTGIDPLMPGTRPLDGWTISQLAGKRPGPYWRKPGSERLWTVMPRNALPRSLGQ